MTLLASYVDQFANARILCVGEVMLDRFLYGTVDRISPEAPIPVFHVRTKNRMLGGSGNVVRNISDLSGHVHFITCLGEDESGRLIEDFLKTTPGVTFELIKTPNRPTTLKTRYVADNQQMLRVDEEETTSIAQNLRDQVYQAFTKHVQNCDVVILSDYGKGLFERSFNCKMIQEARKYNKLVIVDPKSNDFKDYEGASLITPNAKEFKGALGSIDPSHQDFEGQAKALRAHASLEALLVTQGKEGMTLFEGQGNAHAIPSHALEVYDVSGAGDTVIATLSLALAVKASYLEAMHLANHAAGLVVAKAGTATTTANELKDALHGTDHALITPLDKAKSQIQRWQDQGLKVGFTNGCYDILHAGHLSLLQQAKERCDRLVIGLNTDASVQRLKGPTRPINPEIERGTLLASLSLVDMVVLFDEDTPLGLITHLKPDLLVKGADYTVDQVVGAKEVLAWGGDVYLAELVPGRSTTNILKAGSV